MAGGRKIRVKSGEEEKSYFFGIVKKRVPVFNFFRQKNSRTSIFNEVFSPADYIGESYQERKERALEDANNNLKFYKRLIEEEIYPTGTKVKLKKIRHTDAYHLEFFMPEISALSDDISKYRNWRKFKEKIKEIDRNKTKIQEKMRAVGEEFVEGFVGLEEDVHPYRNYGFDKDGKLKYFDLGVLSRALPHKHRKEFGRGRYNYLNEGQLRKRNLEGISVVIIFLLIGVSFGNFLTGNFLGFSFIYYLQIIFVSLFILILIGFFFYVFWKGSFFSKD